MKKQTHIAYLGPMQVKRNRAKVGNAFMNYSILKTDKKKTRYLGLLIQLKDKSGMKTLDTFLVHLPLAAVSRMINRVKKDGPIQFEWSEHRAWQFIDLSKGETYDRSRARAYALKRLAKTRARRKEVRAERLRLLKQKRAGGLKLKLHKKT